jgi:SAM-dependent methyltransferase
MPTVPSERGAHPEPEPRPSHQYREVAESFGSDAARYDRSRPSYPDALVNRIVAASPGRAVLDVGCGTGIAARQFQAAGCQVLGVDPDERMAELARRAGLDVEVATIETWDPAGRSFDAVIAGQAWHWVDPVAGAAKAAQALRRGGRLAVFWNAFLPPPEVGEAMAAGFRAIAPDSRAVRRGMPGPEAYAQMCEKAADGMRQAGGFGDLEQWRSDWQRHYGRDEWLDQVPTFGGYSRLPAAVQAELLAGLRDAIDGIGGSFTMRYATVAATATRTGRRGPRPSTTTETPGG